MRTASSSKDDKGEIMSFAVQAGRGHGEARLEPKDPNKYCTHCKRTGHIVGNCFQLTGYPEWWGDRPRGSGCGGAGFGAGCGRGVGVRANVAATPPVTSSSQGAISEQTGFPGVSDEQWKWLQHFLTQRILK